MNRLLLLLACLLVGVAPLQAQDPVLKELNSRSVAAVQSITGTYFKTLPYQKPFSRFLQELLADSDLQDKVVNQRTDSTFFYFSGTYKRFNSFIYRPTTLKLIVAESEFAPSDTSSYKDTVVYCQLLVTADTTERGRDFVKKEYSRLLRKSTPEFYHSSYALGSQSNAHSGELSHCFIQPFAVAPLTIAWARNKDTREYTLSISLAMKVKANEAGMITLPQETVYSTQ